MSESEEECCNSGCNNCILDIRQQKLVAQKKVDISERSNLFDSTYRKFKIAEIDQLTENVLHIKFEYFNDNTNENNNFAIFMIPTHHLMLRMKLKENDIRHIEKHDKEMIENYISRPYTPFKCDEIGLTFEILVKLIPNGLMSKYIAELRFGDITEWKGAYGNFNWPTIKRDDNSNIHLVCISQGVAFAPLFNLISSILENDEDETRISFFICFQNLDNALFRKEINNCKQYWNFQSKIYLSQENCKECELKRITNCNCIKSKLFYGEAICNYRLNSEELENIYSNIKSPNIYTVVCGTDSLVALVKDTITQINHNKLKETYFRIE